MQNSSPNTNSPILSVCIPTYNRAECLKQCLESIVSQFSDPAVAGKVEVVISDNASKDDTQSLVGEYQKTFSNVRYSKNVANLGFDRNVLKVVDEARGEYCWLMGDDDGLFQDALSCLLPILESGKYDYLMANCWGYDKQLGKKAVSRPNLKITADQYYNALKDFVRKIPDYRDMVGYFGGMSCQIFKRHVWSGLPNKQAYIGGQAIHLQVILSAFKDLPACVVAKPLVKTRADNMRWETFPGLESMLKRARATRDGMVWIFNLYEIPYSKFRLNLKYYGGLIYSWLEFIAKKTLFRNPAMRNLAKSILGK